MTQDNTKYRLHDAAVLEPLINRFWAWSDMVSPLPYSMHLANYHVKTLEAYLKKPELHLKAARDVKLAGGPYVNIPKERAGEVEDLLRGIRQDQAANLRLAEVAKDFQNYLAKEAVGQSIEPFYDEIPEEIRGCVELNYDYFNHPIVRFIESFFYHSKYYRKDLQSLMFLRQPKDDHRSFFLSTPRLPEKNQLEWPVAFDDPQIDELFKIDREAMTLSQIRDILGIGGAQDEALRAILTDQPLTPPKAWEGKGARVRYFGHACMLVEYNGVSIMTDPWIAPLSEQRDLERLSWADLPERIDYALISHNHHDHWIPETLLRLRHRLGTLVVPRGYGVFYGDSSLRLASKQCGIQNIVELDALDSIPFPDGEIIGVPFFGEHADLCHGKSAYVVRCGKEQMLFAADSNCLDPGIYENVRQAIGPVETLFLGMECVGAPLSWLYGALMPIKLMRSHDQSRRTQACDAVRGRVLVEKLGGKRVYNYAMGCEPWMEYSMGLGNTTSSPQVKESDRFIAGLREDGFEQVGRPLGTFELHLP